MKRSTRILSALGTTALLASISLPAAAQGRGSFTLYDRDGNGVVTQQEFDQVRAQRRGATPGQGQGRDMGRGMNRPDFADFDTNRDGAISQDELNQYRAQRLQERAAEGRMMRNAANAQPFGDMDTNKDGEIDANEFANHQGQQPRGRNR